MSSQCKKCNWYVDDHPCCLLVDLNKHGVREKLLSGAEGRCVDYKIYIPTTQDERIGVSGGIYTGAENLQQNSDGSWSKAEPMPYKPDTRPMWKRLLAVLGLFVGIGWNRE